MPRFSTQQNQSVGEVLPGTFSESPDRECNGLWVLEKSL
jgi:hypothetical protein